MTDWTGNKKSIYVTLGASNHVEEDRQEDDYYATDPCAIDALLEEFKPYDIVWEPACGEGHLSRRLTELGYVVISSDIIDRGHGLAADFLSTDRNRFRHEVDIITNPPYKYAQEFIEAAIEHVSPGYHVCMFLKVQFLEGKKRKEMFKKYPPKMVLVSSSRIKCAKNGEFSGLTSSAVAYAWFIWQKGYIGNTIVRWVN